MTYGRRANASRGFCCDMADDMRAPFGNAAIAFGLVSSRSIIPGNGSLSRPTSTPRTSFERKVEIEKQIQALRPD